jgi:hypothetical protein
MSIKVGELRSSQAVHTFGVGGHVDLPKFSAIVLGLEQWKRGGWTPIGTDNAIVEPRLLGLVRSFLGPQVKQLTRMPVPPPDVEDKDAVGIPLATFPRWYRCSRCEIAAPLDQGIFTFKRNLYKPDETGYFHENCTKAHGGKPPQVAPVRFVVACRNGHLDDFPWKAFLAGGGKGCDGSNPKCGKSVYIQERGVAAEVADIWVKCAAEGCDASRQMIHAFGESARDQLGTCTRHHPHFGPGHQDAVCEDGELRTMLLGASNQWFGVMASALGLPSGGEELPSLVAKHWVTLKDAANDAVVTFLRTSGGLETCGLSKYSNDEIVAAIEAHAEGGSDAESPKTELAEIKDEEWALFSNWHTAPKTDPDFQLRGVGVPDRYQSLIDEIVAVDRLRLVKSLTGFTRIDSPGDYADIAEIPDVKRVALSSGPPEWVPSYEVRGEGIFIQLREDAIVEWAARPKVEERAAAMGKAYVSFRRSRDLEPDEGFDAIRYTLLHTLSHLLLREFAVECGYTSASLQERIYSRGPHDDAGPQAGILLMTAASDSQGTLGGLVELAQPERLARHLDQALSRACLCASDPLCSEHVPSGEDRTLHGAACHACGFVSETSCERGNKFLDRSLLVPVIGTDVDGFFAEVIGR